MLETRRPNEVALGGAGSLQLPASLGLWRESSVSGGMSLERHVANSNPTHTSAPTLSLTLTRRVASLQRQASRGRVSSRASSPASFHRTFGGRGGGAATPTPTPYPLFPFPYLYPYPYPYPHPYPCPCP